MKTITLLITILFMTLPLSAIDKGSWEIYTSYNDITEIEPAGNQAVSYTHLDVYKRQRRNTRRNGTCLDIAAERCNQRIGRSQLYRPAGKEYEVCAC